MSRYLWSKTLSMEISIRKATSIDMPEVLELIKELAVFEKEPDAVKISAQDLQSYGYGDIPMFQCFVAEAATEIVGAALVYFRFSTWVGPTVHLEDLIVKQPMRRKGVGAKLYSAVMCYGQEQGVKRIEWNVIDWNEGAIKFYENSGAKVLPDWSVVQMDEEGIKNYIDRLD
ncbi:MAG: GNAT superfamily N-acetyltransferase [Ulvibacter sp.]|jgi:GNAT superfamily N-acetyltransferase